MKTTLNQSGRMSRALHGWLERQERRFRSIPPSRRTLVIILVAVCLYGGFILLNQLWLNQMLNNAFGRYSDLNFYHERAQAVLAGKVLYRNLTIEAPPLIVYLYIPPQVAGGSNLAYQLYFSFFSVLTALTLYWGLRRFNDYRAFVVALLFLFSPFALGESPIGIEDTSIVVFFFILAAILALHSRDRLSTLVATLGAWTKVFTVLFYPVLFLHTRSWRERWKQLAIIVVVSLLISSPFLILCPVQFLNFPLYYLGIGGGTGIGNGTSPVSGISVWDYLSTAGIDIPGAVLLALLVGAYLGALWWGRRKKYDLWKGTLLVLVAFVVFYSRMQVGYFLLPVAFLLPFAAEDLRIAARCFLLAVPLYGTLLFTRDNQVYVPIINIPYAWLVGLALTVIGLWLLADTARLCLSKESFIFRKGES